ncbi:hypothetical protein DPMN_035969 [Dreissena polymorpha]|uniref:Uncharacterized protein n=1 Tax=Dreissena polymorpha TaxID=45954 RepID=A0A9D4RNF1_DREPO|nr:hypothetical protein DPMN_035969 [Dreissena polymorpha]
MPSRLLQRCQHGHLYCLSNWNDYPIPRNHIKQSMHCCLRPGLCINDWLPAMLPVCQGVIQRQYNNLHSLSQWEFHDISWSIVYCRL